MTTYFVLQCANVFMLLVVSGCAIALVKEFHDDNKFYQELERKHYEWWHPEEIEGDEQEGE